MTVLRPLSHGSVRCGGRNRRGRTTVYHRGGGGRVRIRRILASPRPLAGTAAYVVRRDRRPGRPFQPLLLVAYRSGHLAYHRPTVGVGPGSLLRAEDRLFTRRTGFAFPLGLLPPGSPVHSLELRPGSGAQLLRAAGSGGQLLRHYGPRLALVRLPSGRRRLVPAAAWATLGRPAGGRSRYLRLTTAGQRRRRGRRPAVRGVAMNPVDHPHGGGQGKTSGGRPSVTPWGRPTKGGRTRRRRHPTNRFLLR